MIKLLSDKNEDEIVYLSLEHDGSEVWLVASESDGRRKTYLLAIRENGTLILSANAQRAGIKTDDNGRIVIAEG